LANMLETVIPYAEDKNHPFFEKREVKTRGILVFSTDKGLCGPLNSNIFRALGQEKGDIRYYSIGRKARQFLSRANKNMVADFELTDDVKFAEVRPMLDTLFNDYDAGVIDTVEVIYPAFVNTLKQEPTLLTIVPFIDVHTMVEKLRARAGKNDIGELPQESRELKFEPSVDAIFDELPRLFVRQEIHQLLYESKASEHSARMVAMKTATDNADKLSKTLQLQYNKARQAAITQEILEISAATAAH
ncbi:MAG: ATP synthase F1 subunit gamma, partial [Verrucomicrobiota bacterium]